MVLISIFFFEGAWRQSTMEVGTDHLILSSWRLREGRCLHVFWKAAMHWTGGLVTVFHRLPSYHDALVLYAKFLHPGSVQLPQQTHDASLFSGAGWTVHQQVREVTTLNLQNKQFKRIVLQPLLTSSRGACAAFLKAPATSRVLILFR